MEWAVTGVVVVVLVTIASLMTRHAYKGWGNALATIKTRDKQIESLRAENNRLRSPIESDVERGKSAAAELAGRGLRPDGTPNDSS